MTIRMALVGLAAASMLASAPALASSESSASSNESNVQSELAEMRALVEGLQQRVEAQDEQIGHQAERLSEAQLAVREQQRPMAGQRGLKSAVSEFWGGVDVGLSVAGSYAYNFDNPDPGGIFPGVGGNTGTSGAFYPFHGNHNSFQVDQVWLDIGKGTTEESRAGFGFTTLYGNTAAFLGQGSPVAPLTAGFTGGDTTSNYYVHQAYVSYLAPLGEGVEFTFGKFATLIGAEVADATQNFNITAGNVYNLFQPIDHVGLLASTSVGPLSFAAGVVNEGGLGISSPDVNKEKTYLGQVAFSQDNAGIGVTVLYGADGQNPNAATLGDNDARAGLVDVVATFEGDGFEAWVNADYLWLEGNRASAWGIAVAGRVPLTDELSSALRLEYAADKTSGSAGGAFPGGLFGLADGSSHSDVWSITGTLAYELAQNLELKTEVRWDRVTNGNPDEFPGNTTGSSTGDQVVGLAQVVYGF